MSATKMLLGDVVGKVKCDILVSLLRVCGRGQGPLAGNKADGRDHRRARLEQGVDVNSRSGSCWDLQIRSRALAG